jgi:3-oxoacyl-[acyl-carrier protein] reductase
MVETDMKYALVTGAGRGIGRAIAVRLAADGYRVLINYAANDGAAAETLRAVREAGSDGELLKFDVADPEAVNAALDGWKTRNPEAAIEVLVNNAGVRQDGLLMWMERAQWDAVVETSLGGFFNVTRALLLDMLKRKRGRVVNVVSLSGIKGLPGQTNYSAAKGGVMAATKALAQEVGRKGVTVNAVAPGFIRTDMTADVDEASLKAMIPVGRFGEPREVAAAVAFLVSPEAGYITGEVISINGGLYT